MEIKSDLQKKILVRLMHSKALSYNEIWNKEGESNRFNYHLRGLIDKGIVRKDGSDYMLTTRGKKIVTALEGATGESKERPVVCVFILGYDKKEDKILVHMRKKEPFYDYAGIIGGKVEFGENPKKAARREFREETGLSGNMELRAITNYITECGLELMHHVIAFTYICENPTGKLIEENREGENKWMKLNKFKKLKRFPEIDQLIEKTLEKDIDLINAKRIQEDEFLKSEILDEF